MQPEPRKQTLLEQTFDRIKEFVGLPPGRDVDGAPRTYVNDDAPRGTLTADDAEGLPPHQGTGINPTE